MAQKTTCGSGVRDCKLLGKMKTWHIAIAMILIATAARLAASFEISFVNFSPVMAMVFCTAVYLRHKAAWLLPISALVLSDVILNVRYGAGIFHASDLIRYGCYAAAIGLGGLVFRRKNWATIFGGAFGASVLFYVATNTGAWLSDPFYARTAAGWWQALTVGHPQFPPTILFFRNSLTSDLFFTGVFALSMEWMARRHGQPSLLGSKSASTGAAVARDTAS